jgi:hypothetical protein
MPSANIVDCSPDWSRLKPYSALTSGSRTGKTIRSIAFTE